MDSHDPLFVGTGNRVYSIDRATGRIIWTATLDQKIIKMGSNFVSLEFDGEALFAAVYGTLYSLDPESGQIKWSVPLKGTSANPVTFAPSATAGREAAISKKQQDAVG